MTDNPQPQNIGDYEILSVLGNGGMGKVYKVRNTISDRVEAMKILLPDLAHQKDLADRFLREIKVLASLDHPNIAILRTAFTYRNQLVMIMEYIEGLTLAERAAQGPLSVADVTKYMDDVLAALSYAHSRGVIHRDIKPANIMLTPAGLVKLMDFGIARSERDPNLTSTGATLGSLNYMSPEQIEGAAVDARSDIYAVGVTLYQLITGQMPFKGDSGFAIMAAHMKQTPQRPIELRPDLPVALSEIIVMALAKNPSRRFQSADAFRNALSTVRATIPPGLIVTMPSAAHPAPGLVPSGLSAPSPSAAPRQPSSVPPSSPSASTPSPSFPPAPGSLASTPSRPPSSATPQPPSSSPVTPIPAPSASGRPSSSAPGAYAAAYPPTPAHPSTTPVPPSSPAPTPFSYPAPPYAAAPSAPTGYAPTSHPASDASHTSDPPSPPPSYARPNAYATVPPLPRHRGLYITLGAIIVLITLVAAGLTLPRYFRARANDRASRSTLPPSDASSSDSSTPNAATNPTSPSAAPDAATFPSPSATSAAAASSTSSSSAPLNNALSPSATPPPDAPVSASRRAHPATPQAHSSSRQASTSTTSYPPPPPSSAPNAAPLSASSPSPSAAAPSTQSSDASPSSATPAALAALEHQLDQLQSRAAAADASLDTLSHQMQSQGLGLRGDIAAARARMDADISKASSALDAHDATRSTQYLNDAEIQAEKIEKFLGR